MTHKYRVQRWFYIEQDIETDGDAYEALRLARKATEGQPITPTGYGDWNVYNATIRPPRGHIASSQTEDAINILKGNKPARA